MLAALKLNLVIAQTTVINEKPLFGKNPLHMGGFVIVRGQLTP